MRYLLISLLVFLMNDPAGAQTDTVVFRIDLLSTEGYEKPVWQWFGYDEPNYTYMPDGRKLLSEIAALSPLPVFVRTHNLLTTGDGSPGLKWGSTNAYNEDENGEPLYDWSLVDSIFDAYIVRGIKPLAEIGFMPEALSTVPDPYRHTWPENLWTGWAYPPKDYQKWGELVFQLVRHTVERYGTEEVKTWYWEPWNEPNIGYWQGSFEEFCKLYDYTADAVKRACPECMTGGPHTTNPNAPEAGKYLKDFLQHCIEGVNYATGKTGSPLDYIAFHAKGNPELEDENIVMNMSTQLEAIAKGFEVISSFEAYRHLPVVIGECDPEGCAACSVGKHPEYAYRNGTMYSSYTAASHARIRDLAREYQINLAGILTWAFEFEDQPWFSGFRSLATNGVNKPILNVFRMYGLMPEERLRVEGNNYLTSNDIINKGVRGPNSDIAMEGYRDENSFALMIWNYHDMDQGCPAGRISIGVENIPVSRVLTKHYRIDSEYSNAYEAWKRMGSPQEVTAEQYRQLEAAGQLQMYSSPAWKNCPDGKLDFEFTLPGQGISLICVEW